jgi:hypothetical protein
VHVPGRGHVVEPVPDPGRHTVDAHLHARAPRTTYPLPGVP